MKTKITMDEWREALREVEEEKADPIPKGWETSDQIRAKMGGISRACALRNVRKLMAANRAEVKMFKVFVPGRNALMPVPHYRLK